jgi:hypothetical protein
VPLTQDLLAHRPVAALPTTTNVLMLPVHVSRATLVTNVVRQLKNLTFPIRRKRNLPLCIGILQDTVWHRTRKRVLDENAIRHQLGHMSGMRSRPGTRAGFELDRDQACGRLDQVVRAAR